MDGRARRAELGRGSRRDEFTPWEIALDIVLAIAAAWVVLIAYLVAGTRVVLVTTIRPPAG